MTQADSKQRLAAILAADVVGYSRLMTADERATMAALEAARAIFRSRIESVQEAIRLSPRDLLMVIWRVVEAWAHLGAERFDQAAESTRLAIGWNPAFADAHAVLASALGHAERLDEARIAMDECVRRLPGLTLSDQRLKRPFRRAADQQRYLDGLSKAGLAEA